MTLARHRRLPGKRVLELTKRHRGVGQFDREDRGVDAEAFALVDADKAIIRAVQPVGERRSPRMLWSHRREQE